MTANRDSPIQLEIITISANPNHTIQVKADIILTFIRNQTENQQKLMLCGVVECYNMHNSTCR